MIDNSVHGRAGVLLIVALLAAVLLTAAGCSPPPSPGEATAEDTYAVGVAAAERGDYMLAIEVFKRISLDKPLHETADDALLRLADAHRAISDYPSAEEDYRRLLSDYPHSSLVPEAEYELGMTFFDQAMSVSIARDQSMTKQAISQLEYFVAAYPASGFADEAADRILELRSRIAEKGYDSATLYSDLGKPKAARVCLEAVIVEYPDTVWARAALLDKARSFAAEGSRALAENEYQRLLELYPGTEEARTGAAEMAALSG
ncbi:MAG: outer membrane protein assembly factor BamD [Candidatus Eisenbacteria sp.]|nr:outer membrane protein assembly factor BamD [Candidatus Eisenbacteria bacterium]